MLTKTNKVLRDQRYTWKVTFLIKSTKWEYAACKNRQELGRFSANLFGSSCFYDSHLSARKRMINRIENNVGPHGIRHKRQVGSCTPDSKGDSGQFKF